MSLAHPHVGGYLPNLSRLIVSAMLPVCRCVEELANVRHRTNTSSPLRLAMS